MNIYPYCFILKNAQGIYVAHTHPYKKNSTSAHLPAFHPALFVTLSRFNPKKRFVSARREWVKSKSKLHVTQA